MWKALGDWVAASAVHSRAWKQQGSRRPRPNVLPPCLPAGVLLLIVLMAFGRVLLRRAAAAIDELFSASGSMFYNSFAPGRIPETCFFDGDIF